MKATIWIRVENMKRWDSIQDKSAWVNAYLKKSPPNSIVIKKKLEPIVDNTEPQYEPMED